MHWGHYTTKDFIKWEEKPIALAPDSSYDNELGAFSGTAIEVDNKLLLFYTSVSNGLQTQSIATSEDGINFTKIDTNPLINIQNYPKELNEKETRDPKVFKISNTYYVLLGTLENGLGQIVLYKSDDLKSFVYVGPLLNNFDDKRKDFFALKGVYECPDYILIDGHEVLISSPQFMPQKKYEHENIHSNIYMIGKLDVNTGEFKHDEFVEIDGGFDFYAPQSAKLPDGRTIMIAWMQMWDRSMPTASDSWVGAYTLPRELSIIDNKLIQKPVREIVNYRSNTIFYENIELDNNLLELDGIKGNIIELEIEFELNDSNGIELEILKSEKESTKITYDKTDDIIIFDRSKSGIEIKGVEKNLQTRTVYLNSVKNRLSLNIFIDKSTVELFINNGLKTMSSNVYPIMNENRITFKSIGGSANILKVVKHDIIVGD